MSFRPWTTIQRSFGAKLLFALLGTVGFLVALALLVVRDQTARQVEYVASRSAEQASIAFREAEEFQRAQLAELAVTFTASRRTAARVEEAVGGGEEAAEYLVDEIEFELEARRIPSSLVVLTDLDGAPILALGDGERLPPSADLRSTRHLAEELLASDDFERFGYVRLEDRLFSAQATLVAIGNRLVGAVLLGLPVDDAFADRLRAVAGVEVCFVIEAECVVGSSGARHGLAATLDGFGGPSEERRVRAGGERWQVITAPLMPERPGEGARVIAVPLEAVLAPFERITRALALAGGLAMTLAIAISLALSRGLTRPVQALVRATTAVARGEYGTRVEVSSRDEMGRLADAFNDMTHGLLLKEQYRGVLDKVVSPEIAEELLRGDIALGGENRDVTTVFADVNGFTALSEGIEPQEVIAMINECMERLSRAVESAGGVVDKYIGDEVMGVFGAPVQQEDHARRAIVAAERMRREMAGLNRARAARGQAALGLSIGVNTGVVVAGNMGSPDRLNYTVLGEPVNLAARLCAAAGRDEILVSAATHARVADIVEATPVGARELKGFSMPVEVLRIDAVDPQVVESTTRRRPLSTATPVALLLAAALGCLPAPAHAQRGGGLPTLEGVGWMSPEGTVQLGFSGRLDLEGYVPGDAPPGLIASTDPFVAGRLRVFGDLFVGQSWYATAELRVDRGEEPAAGDLDARVEQAFLRWSRYGFLGLQAGKFVTPLGGYPSRHHTAADPLVRPPLMYDYRTVLSTFELPASSADFVSWKRPETPDRRPRGAPPIWGSPYPWGAMALGVIGPLDYQLAYVNSAPGTEPEQWAWDEMERPSLIAAVGYRVTPWLRARVSHSRGPYLDPSAETDPLWRDNLSLGGWDQAIFGLEMVFERGHTSLRAEAFHDSWQVVNVEEDVVDISYSVEAVQTLLPGLHVAARYGAITFSEHADPPNDQITWWDYDVRRVQVGGGWRFLRNAGVKAEYMITRAADNDPDDDLASVQLWWEF